MAALLGTIAGRVTLDIRQAVAAYATLRAQNQKTVYAMRGTSESFTGAGKAMVYSGGLMVAAFGLAVKEAAEFERKMDFFGAVTDTNSKKMEQLSKFTLQLAQDTIFSADEIADGMIELGKAGVSAEQIMNGIGQAMANLAAAGDIPLEQSGQIITSTVQQFNLAAEDAVHVTDLLAGAANASIADISDIGVSLKYVGGVANAAGLSFEDTATAISLLAKAGIRGSTAGTSLRQMIVSFGGATGPARDALKELGIITEDGSNAFYDMQGNLKPLSSVFQTLQDHLDGYNNKEKLAYLRTIFNNRALAAASLLTRDGAKGFKEMNKEMSKVTAAEVAHKRLDNLSGDIEILKGNIQTLLVTAGGPFQENMRKWVQGLTKLVQAFGKLDPETQKNIVGFIGAAGAVLLAMGAMNLILGLIFRFVANLLKMGAAIKLLVTFLRSMWTWLRLIVFIFGGELAAALGISAAALLAIVAVIALLVIGFVILYKKSDAFRNIVNQIASAVWNAIQAVGSFLKLLATDPGAAWDQVVEQVNNLWDAIQSVFGRVVDYISTQIGNARDAVGRGITGIINWFQSLPDRAMALLVSFFGWLQSTFTLSNVISALGTAVGTIIGFFILLPVRLLSLLVTMIANMVSIWATLAPKVLGFLAYLVGFAIGLFVRLAMRAQALANQLVVGVIKFFARLPGRVLAFFINMVTGAISLVRRMVSAIPGLAARVVSGIINFFSKLPGRVRTFFSNMINGARQLLSRLPGIARNFAQSARDAIVQALNDLPGLVSSILGKVISAFTGVIRAGFEAAKSVASGLWNGFKAGLGISSPSYIERAMWQITGVVEGETKKLSKQTMYVQKLSEDMAKTTFTTGGWEKGSAPSKFARAASLHSANRNRSQRILSPDQAARMRADHAPSHGQPKKGDQVKIKGTLELRDGDAYIEGIVEDLINEADHADNVTNRRRHRRI